MTHNDLSQNSNKQGITLQQEDSAKGFWLAVSSFILWGLFPIYFYLLREVSALEILAHRILWSMILLLVLGTIIKYPTKWHHLLKSKALLLPCIFSTLFLTVNWLIYIWAVANTMALQGSLGYFINPLVSVLLGVVILGERIKIIQLVGILFALVGVLFLILKTGEFPLIALALAFSFGTYGLIHKRYAIDALAGLTLETIISAPFAAGYMIYLFATSKHSFMAIGWETDLLLLMAGLVTSVPLLMFLASLKYLRLSTVGLLQYVAPTLQFLVAVFVIGEPFNHDKLISFSIVWLGLAIFSIEAIRQRRISDRKRK